MAGDWIQWTKGLARKREVVMMAAALKRDSHEVAGRLMTVWEWADENIPEEAIDSEGTAVIKMSPASGDNNAFIDTVAGLPGFANAMSDAEWLRSRNGSLTFPNYGRHNGETAKTRGRNAKNQAKRRAKPVTELSPDAGDKKVTREEKSRVSNRIEATSTKSNWKKLLASFGPLTPESLADDARLVDTFRAWRPSASDHDLVYLLACASRALRQCQNGKADDASGLFGKFLLQGPRKTEEQLQPADWTDGEERLAQCRSTKC